MPRWTEGAPQRLQRAALELFLEHGYDNVTVAEIAERAGLTRRSFFNHFSDKREIFFAGAAAFQAHVVDYIAAADNDRQPYDVAIAALTSAGREVANVAGDAAGPVRTLIAASAELRERDLTKMATVARAITEALVARGTSRRTADLTARAAVTVFTVGFDDWVDRPDRDLAALMAKAAADLGHAITAEPAK